MRKGDVSLWQILSAVLITLVVVTVLLPWFYRVDDGHPPHRTRCLSNTKQLALSLVIYVSDWDDRFPVQGVSAGTDWAPLAHAYLKTGEVYKCPSDSTQLLKSHSSPIGGMPRHVLSYGYNRNVALHPASASMTEPASTILLFEVAGAAGYIDGPSRTVPSSPVADGRMPFPRAVAARVGEPAIYAMDTLGGRVLNGGETQEPRHQSPITCYAFCDGHAKAEQPERVSGGLNALHPKDAQTGARAAGAEYSTGGMTFSTR